MGQGNVAFPFVGRSEKLHGKTHRWEWGGREIGAESSTISKTHKKADGDKRTIPIFFGPQLRSKMKSNIRC